MKLSTSRLGTILFYISIAGYYLGTILFALWLNAVLKIPSLFNIPIRTFGFALAIFGLFLISWCCWLQYKVGQGTTGFSEPTKKVVNKGPYGVVRNPIYWGQFLIFSGVGILLNIGAMFLLLPIIIIAMHGWVIVKEEPSMKKRFGQEWVNYASRVPRWFPKLVKIRSNKGQTNQSSPSERDNEYKKRTSVQKKEK